MRDRSDAPAALNDFRLARACEITMQVTCYDESLFDHDIVETVCISYKCEGNTTVWRRLSHTATPESGDGEVYPCRATCPHSRTHSAGSAEEGLCPCRCRECHPARGGSRSQRARSNASLRGPQGLGGNHEGAGQDQRSSTPPRWSGTASLAPHGPSTSPESAGSPSKYA